MSTKERSKSRHPTTPPPPRTPKMKDNRPPTDLLLAMSHAAAQRQQHGAQQREEQRSHALLAWDQAHVLTPQREQEQESDERQKALIKELIRSMFQAELKAWREQRAKAARRDRLSRAEVDDEVLRMVEEVHRSVGLDKRRLDDGTEEPHEAWRGRMIALRKQIYRVWNENHGRISMGLPRYVEGCPVREGIAPPKFLPGGRQKMSGLGSCLQCEVKGLGCSRSVLTGRVSGRDVQSRGCRRCEDEGERCIAEFEVDDDDDENEEDDDGDEGNGEKKKKKSYMWDWVDAGAGPDTEEALAEAVDMWERRRRGARLELVGGRMQWVEVRGFAPPRVTDDVI